jgi:N-acetylmuramoyl-L-alanine amidase
VYNSSNKILFNLLFFFILSSLSFSGEKLDVIVIDAGHGGRDPGTIGLSGVQEKNINLPIALKLGEMIQKNFPGIRIVQIRTKDEYIDVKDRSVIANREKAKLFISIHCNYKKQEETEKNGFEVYLLNPERFPEAVSFTLKENKLLGYERFGQDSVDFFMFSLLAQNGYFRFSQYLASSIEINFLNATTLASRGILQSGFWVLLGSSMPCVLVECGYLSDLNDEKYLSSPEGQNAVVRALYDGFVSYKSLYELNP